MDEKTKEQVHHLLKGRWEAIDGREREKPSMDDVEPAMEPGAEVIDIAQSLEQIDRDQSLMEQGRREALAIERALAKIASSSFGICEDCGEEIPPKRLMIVPEARLCANCQAYEERQASRMRAVHIAK
jgi:DnaK suppressor protein